MKDDDKRAGQIPAHHHCGHDPNCNLETLIAMEKSVVEEQDGNFDSSHGDHVDDLGEEVSLQPRISAFFLSPKTERRSSDGLNTLPM